MNQDVLLIVLVVASAWVLAHLVFERLQSRFLFTTGAEYILVGIGLGPLSFVELVHADTLLRLQPLIALAIGWFGLMYGMQANFRELVSERDGTVQLTLWETVITLVLVGTLSLGLLQSGFVGDLEDESTHLGALVLGAAAAVGSRSVIELVQRRYQAEGRLTNLLAGTARLGELLAIAAFGTIFCLYHPEVEAPWGAGRIITPFEWLGITVGLGGLLALLCRGLLQEDDQDKLFLALLGTIVFASGAAYYLRLSPMLLNLSLGVVLVNVLPDAEGVRQALQRAFRPMVIILLIFAGALWAVPESGVQGALLAVCFIIVRAAAKLLGGWIGASFVGESLRRDLGRGLLGHGEVAVAMAISFRLAFWDNPLVDQEMVNLVFTAILASVLLSDLWSPTLAKRTLIDAGEIKADQAVIVEEAS